MFGIPRYRLDGERPLEALRQFLRRLLEFLVLRVVIVLNAQRLLAQFPEFRPAVRHGGGIELFVEVLQGRAQGSVHVGLDGPEFPVVLVDVAGGGRQACAEVVEAPRCALTRLTVFPPKCSSG